MNTDEIIASLDTEIARLEHVRSLIANPAAPKRRGRPSTSTKAAPPRRSISAEGRKRIAEAQRKRWAARKKQSSAKATRVSVKDTTK